MLQTHKRYVVITHVVYVQFFVMVQIVFTVLRAAHDYKADKCCCKPRRDAARLGTVARSKSCGAEKTSRRCCKSGWDAASRDGTLEGRASLPFLVGDAASRDGVL